MAEDLFGEVPACQQTPSGRGPKGGKHYVKQCGYVAMPGTGPSGESCGTCKHVVRGGQVKRFLKCALMRAKWTHSPKTDVLARSPACKRWEKVAV